MAVVNCKKYDNETSPKAGICSKYGMSIPESRKTFKTMAGILAMSFIAAMQPVYGSEPSDTSHAATAAQASSAAPSVTMPPSPHGIAPGLPASGSNKAPEIVWEPIGKYSKAEINMASDTIGNLFAHMKKMAALESSVAPLVQGGKKVKDKDAALRAARKYSADAQEESKQIEQFQIPALKNQQAVEMILKAKTALKNASEIQKERASKVIKLFSGKADSKALSDEIQQLGSQRMSAAFQFVTAYMGYESYGYTADQIDLETGRLKKDAKPDRLEPESHK